MKGKKQTDMWGSDAGRGATNWKPSEKDPGEEAMFIVQRALKTVNHVQLLQTEGLSAGLDEQFVF
jgi:hypothetical protein